MSDAHWLTRYDPASGEPEGTICHCSIGEDHDLADVPEDDTDSGLLVAAPAAPSVLCGDTFAGKVCGLPAGHHPATFHGEAPEGLPARIAAAIHASVCESDPESGCRWMVDGEDCDISAFLPAADNVLRLPELHQVLELWSGNLGAPAPVDAPPLPTLAGVVRGVPAPHEYEPAEPRLPDTPDPLCVCGKPWDDADAHTQDEGEEEPTVTVLCGSTRFYDDFVAKAKELTLGGEIVLAPGVYAHMGDSITAEEKEALDRLHLAKIRNADRVVVVARNGYVGESTAREIDFATAIGRPVEMWDPAQEVDG